MRRMRAKWKFASWTPRAECSTRPNVEVKEGRNEVQLWMGHLPQGQYVVHVLFGSHRADQSEPMELVAEKVIILPGS